MLRLASDADVHGDIIRGLRRHKPDIDLVRVQDALPEGWSDPMILDWVADENRVLITNDRNTMIDFAYQRAASGEPGGVMKPFPGLIVTTQKQPIGLAIQDILLIAEYMSPEEIMDKAVVILPLRS